MKASIGENENVKRFIKDIRKIAKDNGIRIFLYNKEYIKDSGDICSGYFIDSPKPKIVIATKKKIEDWLPVFIHEAAHMFQYLEKCDVWKNLKYGRNGDSITEFFSWLSGEKELHEELITYHYMVLTTFEMDAEKRTVEMIKKYKLPINIEEYIQKANSYVWFYKAVMESRNWGDEKGFKNFKQLYKLAPKTWTKNRYNPPRKFIEACKKYCL